MKINSILILAAVVAAQDVKLENDMNNVADSFFNLLNGVDESLGKALSKIVEENKPAITDLGDKLDTLKESVQPKVDEAFDHVNDQIEKVADKVGEWANKASDFFHKVGDEIDYEAMPTIGDWEDVVKLQNKAAKE